AFQRRRVPAAPRVLAAIGQAVGQVEVAVVEAERRQVGDVGAPHVGVGADPKVGRQADVLRSDGAPAADGIAQLQTGPVEIGLQVYQVAVRGVPAVAGRIGV